MKLFSALLLLALSSSSTHAQNAQGYMDYWQGTGLTLQNFKTDVLPRCNETVYTMLGCLDALNGAAGAAADPIKYAANGEKEAGVSELGAKREDLGDGIIGYTLTTGPRKYFTDFRKISKAEKELHFRTIEALVKKNEARGTKIDLTSRFDQAFRNIDATVLKEHESAVAGEMYNLFFAVVWDPHTAIIPKAELLAVSNNPDEAHTGMGFEYYKNTEVATVLASIRENSPAMKAGLRRNDQIVSIDGTVLAGKSFKDVKALISGPVGQKSNLVISRKGKTFNLSLTRAKYLVPNVSHRIVNDMGIKYGYIRIRSFESFDADDQIKKIIFELQKQRVWGFILDLRSNGGGVIETAFDVGSQFIGRNKVLATKVRFQSSTKTEEKETMGGNYPQLTSLPMVTLIDGYTGSASELLAGALRDHDRSFLLGDRTFGKGTIHSTTKTFSSGSYAANGKISECRTEARFLQPDGTTNQIVGILPDFKVALFPGATEQDEPVMREEDRYLTSIPPLNAAVVRPRSALVQKVDRCLNKRMAEKKFQELDPTSQNGADFRLLSAQEVLKCLN